jgi:ferrous iron transport protein B
MSPSEPSAIRSEREPPTAPAARSRIIAIAGNPNSGKTTLFNRLTGLNQRVGNYPGVTVERRSGTLAFALGATAMVIDLPGTYSLISRSKDEAVAFEVLTGRSSSEKPELAVIVIDASNLDRNLYLALQILELGIPAVVALNMIDLAKEHGLELDADKLTEALGIPVVPIVASVGIGIDRLKDAIQRALSTPPVPRARAWKMSVDEEAAIGTLSAAITAKKNGTCRCPDGESIWLLSTLAIASSGSTLDTDDDPLTAEKDIEEALGIARTTLQNAGIDFPARLIQARYAIATSIAESATKKIQRPARTATDRIDAVLLHPILGGVIFLGVMGLVFQSIFSWAQPIMDAIQDAVAATGNFVHALLPKGALSDLATDGVIGGVGNVLVFIPQIAILSFFIAILEDSGYLARAAFITDRLMAKIGLHGRAFVPLISGFACAVPAIMATRTIESKKDRLVTILVTPLMSCSARLPVYGLIISALFASDRHFLGFISVGAILFLAMYLLSVTMTITAAFILKRTVLKSPTPPFVLELPPYRRPVLKSVLQRVFERCRVFVRDAGTIILACSIVLWAALYFPRGSSFTMMRGGEKPAESADVSAVVEKVDTGVQDSYAGRLGRFIEPAIRPLGFDWKIGIGLLASFAAREVLVSTLGLVYGVGRGADEESVPLREAIRKEADPVTKAPVYTPLVGLALMVFFVLACQCMSTLAVVRRETGSWKWPAFMFAYMTVLAWVGAFVVYQGGRLLGFS